LTLHHWFNSDAASLLCKKWENGTHRVNKTREVGSLATLKLLVYKSHPLSLVIEMVSEAVQKQTVDLTTW